MAKTPLDIQTSPKAEEKANLQTIDTYSRIILEFLTEVSLIKRLLGKCLEANFIFAFWD